MPEYNMAAAAARGGGRLFAPTPYDRPVAVAAAAAADDPVVNSRNSMVSDQSNNDRALSPMSSRSSLHPVGADIRASSSESDPRNIARALSGGVGGGGVGGGSGGGGVVGAGGVGGVAGGGAGILGGIAGVSQSSSVSGGGQRHHHHQQQQQQQQQQHGLVGTTLRKQPSSFFSGSKIRHLKKPDGVPLWRVDIQFDFLKAIFSDKEKVFTNSYDRRKEQTFADVYVDAMARSSKTSKILRDKLMSERANALNMAMVCLLVNVGRMNTTLNFFPEMKAQLRTYHSIPSLQTYTDSHTYKQLQDAPRLKSILKGACEDRKEPMSIEQLMKVNVPRTNPINLVFLVSTYAPKISETHFPESIDFYDLIMRSTLSSKSRARAFLWLMWWYLESDFSQKAALSNPYGRGLEHKGGDVFCRVPEFEHLTEEQALLENLDEVPEQEYGKKMQAERKRIMEAHTSGIPLPSIGKKGKKSSIRNSTRTTKRNYSHLDEYESEDRTRTGSPENQVLTPGGIISTSNFATLLHENEPAQSPSDSPVKNRGGRPKYARRYGDGELKPTPKITLKMGGKQLSGNTMDPSTSSATFLARSILPLGNGTQLTPGGGGGTPKTRPLSNHQVLMHEYRRDLANHYLEKRLRSLDQQYKQTRSRKAFFPRVWKRIKAMPDPFANSDDEMCQPSSHPTNTTSSSSTAAAAAAAATGPPPSLPLLSSSSSSPPLPIIHPDHPSPTHKKSTKLPPPLPTITTSNITTAAAATTATTTTTTTTTSTENVTTKKYYANGTTTRGPAGLIPLDDETDDFGEEAASLAAVLRRNRRRLLRWEEADRKRGFIDGFSGGGGSGDGDGDGGGELVGGEGRGASSSGGGEEEESGEEEEDEEDEEEDEERDVVARVIGVCGAAGGVRGGGGGGGGGGKEGFYSASEEEEGSGDEVEMEDDEGEDEVEGDEGDEMEVEVE